MDNNKKQIIEETAMQMLSGGAYEFVTILDLLDELQAAGQQYNFEEVEAYMDGLTRNSDWTWQPMPDSPGARLYNKGFDPAIEHMVEEVGQIRMALSQKYYLSALAPETWQIATQIQRNLILKQQTK